MFGWKLLKLRSGTSFLTIVCIFLGMLISVYLTSIKTPLSRSDMISIQRMKEMTEQINLLKQQNEEYSKQIENYTQELERLQTEASETNIATQQIHKQLRQAQIDAGLIDVEGPGIELVLSDAERELFPGEPVSNLIVHDSDLINIVNELKFAGAEAISINGQRVIYNSKIRCGGPIIIVNNSRFAPPYVIRAIGDVEKLENTLKKENGLYDAFLFYGLKISLKRMDNMKINKFNEKLDFKYAKPVKEEGE